MLSASVSVLGSTLFACAAGGKGGPCLLHLLSLDVQAPYAGGGKGGPCLLHLVS